MENKVVKRFDVLYYHDVDRQKEFSHAYSETWETIEYFCPKCGSQNVWRENSLGDYYVGEEHICTKCKSSFYLPMGVMEAKDEQDEQRIANLCAD